MRFTGSSRGYGPPRGGATGFSVAKKGNAMKRLFLLLVLAAITLVAGTLAGAIAPPAALELPTAFNHPAALAIEYQAVVQAVESLDAVFDRIESGTLYQARVTPASETFGATQASVPGAKRVASDAILLDPEIFADTGQSGAAVDTEYARHSSPGVRPAPTHPPARAVQGCA